MRVFSHKAIFGSSVLLGIAAVLVLAAYQRWTEAPRVSRLTDDVWVTEQLQLDTIRKARARGFATIIDLRPDGEAADQPGAVDVAARAQDNRMAFAYVPVPHGDIPDGAVVALQNALSANPKPILLYCRSGRRAARTWSLVEASRSGGLDADAIQAAVARSGQSAVDLQAEIARRVARRS